MFFDEIRTLKALKHPKNTLNFQRICVNRNPR